MDKIGMFLDWMSRDRLSRICSCPFQNEFDNAGEDADLICVECQSSVGLGEDMEYLGQCPCNQLGAEEAMARVIQLIHNYEVEG